MLCSVDEPGRNMVDTALNGISFDIPNPWISGSCPTAGLVTFFFCREQVTIAKLRAEVEKKHPASYPPDWAQPAGFEWCAFAA